MDAPKKPTGDNKRAGIEVKRQNFIPLFARLRQQKRVLSLIVYLHVPNIRNFYVLKVAAVLL
jgi:hypothetical protein